MKTTRRYTVLLADRATGVVRRFTFSVRPMLGVVVTILTIPVLIGLGAKWSARAEIDQLRSSNALLEQENGSYRAATGALSTQIQSLEGVIDDLGARSALDPAAARAMAKLPAVVKSRASGGSTESALSNAVKTSILSTPEDTFGVLRDVLVGLENRLRSVRKNVEKREELANATPSIWPAHGWLSSGFGGRPDPFTGENGYHAGLDISADRGQPVYATADGTVESASWGGDYGNLVILKHGFGLVTRYGHLSRFAVKTGESVKRGEVIGYVGSTGRSTGSHLHYEILANGRLLNPLQLLTQPATR